MLRAIALVTTLAIPAVSAAQQPCTPNAQQIVNQLYRTMLERSADRGTNDFVRRLSTGQLTVRELVRELALSQEHMQRFAPATNNDAQRRAAVTAFYRHILGREPDQGGLQAHMDGMRTQGPAAVVEAMLNSEEYTQRFGDFGVPGTDRRYCGAYANNTQNRIDPQLRAMDTNRDGRITRGEWQGTNWAFANADLNGDGVITADELGGSAVDRNRPVGTSGILSEEAAARFDALDRNRNGRIERNEWRGTAAEFTRLDTNRNNLLSREEIAAASNAAPDDFRQLDLNNDGRLTIEEWNWNRRTFDQQDTNGDGVITPREFTGRPVNRNNGF